MGLYLLLFHVLNLNAHGIPLEVVSKLHPIAVPPFIVVVKKTFRYSNVFSYNHLYQPECFYEQWYKRISRQIAFWRHRWAGDGFLRGQRHCHKLTIDIQISSLGPEDRQGYRQSLRADSKINAIYELINVQMQN